MSQQQVNNSNDNNSGEEPSKLYKMFWNVQVWDVFTKETLNVVAAMVIKQQMLGPHNLFQASSVSTNTKMICPGAKSHEFSLPSIWTALG